MNPVLNNSITQTVVAIINQFRPFTICCELITADYARRVLSCDMRFCEGPTATY